jgi:hypothetical protein
MNRRLLSFGIFLIVSVFAIGAPAQNPKITEWLEDFSQLKRELSDHYANLDWAVEVRKLDLKGLSQQTELRLRQAQDDTEAKRAIGSFLNTFGDGHLSVEWRANNVTVAGATDIRPNIDQPPLCKRLRFETQNYPPRVVFTELGNFTPINTSDSKYFSIGILAVRPGMIVGTIRISIFSEYAFYDLCEQTTARLGMAKDSPCDEECADRIERESANLLTAALARQIDVLKSNKIGLLLVDITGNGGGTNWSEPAARTLSGKSLLSPRQQFIRHAHWTRQLERRLQVIEADAAKRESLNRKLLLRSAAILRKALTETQRPCSRDAVWENRKPECSIVVSDPVLFPQSVLPFAKPGTLPDKPSSRYLFFPSRYAYREGVYDGRLMILVDQGTWSSAEYFAAMLRDNDAATVVGSPTGGAGCGYTNGGIATYLKNSGARIKIPDCVRLRADGSNEVAGITPDILIAWRSNDSPYQRAKRVSDALFASSTKIHVKN